MKDQLTKSMSTFGFMIIQTLVTDIEPDQRVRAAMNEINAASRMRYASLTLLQALLLGYIIPLVWPAAVAILLCILQFV